jgi:hypothetical protein
MSVQGINGGPAFPQPPCLNDANEIVSPMDYNEAGMTLRDYFAAHAPPPPAWWLNRYDQCFSSAPDLGTAAQHLAQWRFAYADAMLAEREQDAPALRKRGL